MRWEETLALGLLLRGKIAVEGGGAPELEGRDRGARGREAAGFSALVEVGLRRGFCVGGPGARVPCGRETVPALEGKNVRNKAARRRGTS